MKIICNQIDLLNGVNTVLKAVSTRTTMPILECILLKSTLNGFKLTTNDLEIGIESQVEAQVIEPGSVAIEAKILSEIVKKLPDNDIEITVDENNRATIRCEKSKFTISGQPSEEFIPIPEVTKNQYISISQLQLKEMIRQTIFSTAVEEIRPVTTGELFEIKNDELCIVSIDGHRVSLRRIQFKNAPEDIKVVIPGKTLNEISKLLSTEDDKEVKIYFNNKHVLFEFEQSMVVSRLLEGEFPDYVDIFSRDYETLVKVNKKQFHMSIERAALMSRGSKKSPIKIVMQENKMIITSNTEIGNVYEEVDIEKEGKDMEIAFNPNYLIDILKVIDDETLYLQFTNAHNPCIFKPIEGDVFQYLVLPIKIYA